MQLIQFNHKDRTSSFFYRMEMESFPRAGDYITFRIDGEFKVKKISWVEVEDEVWEIHVDLRKPFTSEF